MLWRNLSGPIGPIIRMMARWYSERHDAEFDDLVQEAWLKIYRRPHATDLVRVAHNAMWAYCRSPRSKWIASQFLPPVPRSDLGMSRLELRDALDCLDKRQRFAITAAFWGNYSYAEIAGKLGVSERTVSHDLQLARNRLREILAA